MSNPWLAVPLSEYEQHMSSEEVQQLGALSELFVEAIERCRPSSIAVLGIAGGNGLEHIDSSVTTRLVGLDLNPEYLESVRERYSHLAGLELHCVDLSRQRLALQPVQLVHAALIFEHAGVLRCLENAIALTAPGGNLSVVLQLPVESGEAECTSRFSSIQNLHSRFSVVRPASLCQSLARPGFRLTHETTRGLTGGKGFWAGIFSGSQSLSRK
jgi:Methyltransferase domain